MPILRKLAIAAALMPWTCAAAYGQDLAPRAYVITPLHSNALTLTYTYYTGGLQFDGAVPITGATANISVPILSYYHALNFFGRSANIVATLPLALRALHHSLEISHAIRRQLSECFGGVAVFLDWLAEISSRGSLDGARDCKPGQSLNISRSRRNSSLVTTASVTVLFHPAAVSLMPEKLVRGNKPRLSEVYIDETRPNAAQVLIRSCRSCAACRRKIHPGESQHA